MNIYRAGNVPGTSCIFGSEFSSTGVLFYYGLLSPSSDSTLLMSQLAPFCISRKSSPEGMGYHTHHGGAVATYPANPVNFRTNCTNGECSNDSRGPGRTSFSDWTYMTLIVYSKNHLSEITKPALGSGSRLSIDRDKYW